MAKFDFGQVNGKRFTPTSWVADENVYQPKIPDPLPLERRFSQPNTAPIPTLKPIGMDSLISSHKSTEPIKPNSNYKAAWIQGTLGSLLGKALTPVAEKITGKKVDLSTLPQPKTLGEKAVSFAGSNLSDLPLWLAGDAVLAKPLAALSKTVPIAKATSLIPKAITPALSTGIRAGATYGGVIAPTETVVQGDGLQGLLQREKQVPLMALGGVALHGAGQLVGKGINEAGNALIDRKVGKLIKPVESNPLADVRKAYKTPSLQEAKKANPITRSVQRGTSLGPLKISDTLTPEYKARQTELNNIFKDLPIGSVDTPMSRNTLQQNIDSSLGIGKPTSGITQSDVEGKFGKPIKSYRKNTDIAEISAEMDGLLKGFESMVKRADEQTPVGTIRKAIFDRGGIRQSNDGIFEEKRIIPNWIRNDKTGMPLDQMADELGMTSDELLASISDSAYKPRDYVAEAQAMANKDPKYLALGNTLDALRAQLPGKKTLSVTPKLKPRELTPKPEPIPIQPQRLELSGNLPVDAQLKTARKLTPIKRDPLQWTNREGIPVGNGPIRPMPEGKIIGDTPVIQPNDIQPKPLPKDDKTFWSSVYKDLHSKGELPPITHDLMKREIKSGKLDISKLSNEEDIRRLLGMDLQKFASNGTPETLTMEQKKIIPLSSQGGQVVKGNGPIAKIVGAEPDIPTGLKERGVSENIRTDANRPDELRDSYSADPLVYKQLGNKETLSKAKDIFDKGLEPAISELDGLIKDLKPEAAPLVKMIADKLTADGNIVRARGLMSNAANRATESGQFGQAFRILREADPETFLMTFDKMLKKLNKEGAERYGKKWNYFDLKPDELDMIGKIERGNQESYDAVFEKIQSRIANEMPATAFEKINAWRHISMLMNPKTHIRNVLGNGIMAAMRKSAQRVSGVLQKTLPAEERTQTVLVNKEYKKIANEYFEANKKELLGGSSKYNESVNLSMPNKRVFRNNALESTRRFNYGLLQKGDNPFFQNAYVDRIASYAQSRGIKDFSKLPQEAFNTAKLEAEQATYKDASDLATYLNKVKNTGKNASLGKKVKAGLTEAALPFTKTPINIIKRGIQYSPIGVINGLAGIKSSKSAAVAIDEMAKGLTGTGVLGLGYLLASKGILTGKASSDADLRAYDSNTGNSPFSVMGKYSYDWMQPFSVPLSVGVEIYNAVKDDPKDKAKMDSIVNNNDVSKLQQMAISSTNAIVEGLTASGDTVFNMSVFRGIKTLLGGQQGVMEGLTQLPQGYVTQFIPSLSGQIAGAIDPLVRQTNIKGDMPQSIKNSIVSKIPIASKTLEPKQTPFGEEMKKIENPIGRTASQFLSPGTITKNQNIDPKIDSELRRLNEFGLTNQFPTMVPNYIEKTQTHPRVTLTPAETSQFQKRVGELTLNSFNQIIGSSAYKATTPNETKGRTVDEEKADILAKAIADAKATAKKEILKSKGLK